MEICKVSYQFLSMRIHLWEFSLAAQALALPFAPPYLQPNATFYKGVNFASGGGGLLNTTNPGLVRFISLANLSWHKQTLHIKICAFFESYIMCSITIHRVCNDLNMMQSPLWWGHLESFRCQTKLLLQTLILQGYFDLEIWFATVHLFNYGSRPSNHDSNVF